MSEYIRNPAEWSFDHLREFGKAVTVTGRSVSPEQGRRGAAAIPEVRRISIGDLRDVLSRGWDDFAAYRTDVMLLYSIYPLLGIVLVRLVFSYGVLPLLFPLASGFALVGPAAAVGLYEMSRRREQGHTVSWLDASRVVYAPRFGAILMLSALLWTAAASAIYSMTLGPAPPDLASLSAHGETGRGAHLDQPQAFRRAHKLDVAPPCWRKRQGKAGPVRGW